MSTNSNGLDRSLELIGSTVELVRPVSNLVGFMDVHFAGILGSGLVFVVGHNSVAL